MHVHVYSGDGEAKFWLEPIVSQAESYGFSPKALRELQKVVEERKIDIQNSWRKHFPD